MNRRMWMMLAEAAEQGRCATPTTKNELRWCQWHAQQGDVRRPFPGIYASSEVWERLKPPERYLYVARAVSLKHPRWVFTGVAAVLAYGVSVGWRLCEVPLAVVTGRAASSRGVTFIHDTRCCRQNRSGVPVVPLAQALCDCAALYDFPNVLGAFDMALRSGKIKENEIPGSSRVLDPPRLQRLMKYTDVKSENGGESYVRGLLLERGIARPMLQVPFTDPESGRVSRVDFAWVGVDGRIIVLEFDGMGKYVDADKAGRRDIAQVVVEQEERTRALMRCGVARILRCKYDDLGNPEFLVRDLLQAGVPYAS